MKTAKMFLLNVPGTTPYWNSIRFEMKAINLYNGYINNQHISIFHTSNLAEFYELSLRTLLAKYVIAINNNDMSHAHERMNDDTKFNCAIHTY